MSNPEVIFESYGNKLIGAAGGGSGSGGHTIQDAEGTDLDQQDTMQFADARVENDDTNGKTVVHVTQEPMTVEEFNESSDLPPGIYPLNGGGVLDDSMIMHDSTHTTRQAIDTLSSKGYKLLWENPSPTSSFASQQITLSSGDYDLLLIIYCVAISYTVIGYASTVIPKGINANTVSCETSSNSTGVSVETRNYIYDSDTQYTVGDAMRQTSGNSRSVNNQYLVPYKIYGIKI